MSDNQFGFSTRAIRAGEHPNFKEGGSGDVVVPIHLSTTFARQKVNEPTAGYEYTRSSNPTRQALEQKLAAIEQATYGLAFSSGLAAETTLLASLVEAGDHIIAFNDLYGGTSRLFNQVFDRYQIEVTYVDASQPKRIEEAIQPNSRIIWLETPTNPLLKLADIHAISEIAKKHHLILIVDNTFLSPYFQQPLALGADIVIYSSTKYIGGHSDVLGGAVLLSDEGYYQKIQYHQNAIGAVLSPFDSYLTLRGIKTLALRMERHQSNALAVARYLESHPKIKQVFYPGLESHPDYALATRQMKGFGGVLSFELKGNTQNAIDFLENLKLFAIAESLGGVESLIELPAAMTHASVSADIRRQIGITDSLIRVSVGVEDIQDLLTDLEEALKKIP